MTLVRCEPNSRRCHGCSDQRRHDRRRRRALLAADAPPPPDSTARPPRGPPRDGSPRPAHRRSPCRTRAARSAGGTAPATEPRSSGAVTNLIRPNPSRRARSSLRTVSSGRASIADQLALLLPLEEQLVEDEAQVRIPAARIDHQRPAEAPEHVVQPGAKQPHQVVHLLQLPQRVGVEVPVSGQQMQLAQQLGRLLRQELAPAPPLALTCRLTSGGRPRPEPLDRTTSTTSGTTSRSRFSMPIFRVIVEEGHPEHDPRMCR